MASMCHYEEKDEYFRLKSPNAEDSGCSKEQYDFSLEQLAAGIRRNIVLDEEVFEETFLRCMICRDRYEEGVKVPKILPCHHSFCLPCLMQLYRSECRQRQGGIVGTSRMAMSGSSITFQCPSCRSPFVTSENHVIQLPTDHRVVQLLDFVKHTNTYTVNFCSKHPLQPLNFFCEPCVKPVCRDCTVLDHRGASDHVVMDLDKALEKYTPKLEEAVCKMEMEVSSLHEKKRVMQDRVKVMDSCHNELLSQVHDTFSLVKEALEMREREVAEAATQAVDREKSRILSSIEKVEEHQLNVREECTKLREALRESNIEEMFNLNKSLSQTSQDHIAVQEIDKGVITNLSFSSRADLLLERLSNFGDIESRVTFSGPRIGYH